MELIFKKNCLVDILHMEGTFKELARDMYCISSIKSLVVYNKGLVPIYSYIHVNTCINVG